MLSLTLSSPRDFDSLVVVPIQSNLWVPFTILLFLATKVFFSPFNNSNSHGVCRSTGPGRQNCNTSVTGDCLPVLADKDNFVIA